VSDLLENPMVSLRDYKSKYEHIELEREDGILQMRFHSGGDSLRFSARFYTEICDAFTNIGADHENRVVIVTGTGPAFCATIDPESAQRFVADLGPELLAKNYWYGKRMLMSLLELEVPLIGAINGPAHVHAELGVLCDLVICTDDTTFSDSTHFQSGGVPGDGAHVVWQHLLGPNRGRYFLFTGQVLSSAEARDLGVVSEVLPPARLMERAWELARDIVAKPLLNVRITRLVLNHNYRKLMLDDLGFGLGTELLAVYANVKS
jgi:enoyl-CoA hydratase/carnithine racemase